MTTAQSSSDVSSIFEPEFIAFVSKQAEADADAVVDYLAANGLGPRTNDGLAQPCVLPGHWLLGCALVLRLKYWELHHIRLHLDGGMLSVAETIDKLESLLSAPVLFREFVDSMWRQILKLYHSSFVWLATECDLTAQIAIVQKEDELFLDELADFLLLAIDNSTR